MRKRGERTLASIRFGSAVVALLFAKAIQAGTWALVSTNCTGGSATGTNSPEFIAFSSINGQFIGSYTLPTSTLELDMYSWIATGPMRI
jgi:hypothetical protein